MNVVIRAIPADAAGDDRPGPFAVPLRPSAGLEGATRLEVWPQSDDNGNRWVDVVAADPISDVLSGLTPDECRALGEALLRAYTRSLGLGVGF